MRFRFNSRELNGFKARLTERLIERYMEQHLIPQLRREEKWDFIVYLVVPWCSIGGSFRDESAFFLSNGVFPTRDLLRSFERVTKALNNVPDGFLVKLKKTGKSKTLKAGLKEMGWKRGESFRRSGYFSTELISSFSSPTDWQEKGYRIQREIVFKTDGYEERVLPIVDGEIEIVEVKCGTSNLAPSQIESYRNAMKQGCSLRYFHVEIVSFERNEFNVEERLITNPNEVRYQIRS